MIILTDQIKTAESKNTEGICIYFAKDGSPVAFGESAVRLHEYFPEFDLSEVPSTEGDISKMICGFTLEAVITRFQKGHKMLVDDERIQIMNIQ